MTEHRDGAASDRAAADQVADDQAAEEEIDAAAIAAQVMRETVGADVREFLVNEIAQASGGKPWDARGEGEREAALQRCGWLVRDLVTRIAELVAAGGRLAITANVRRVGFNDKAIEVALQVSKHHPLRGALADAQGGSIVLRLPNAEAYLAEGWTGAEGAVAGESAEGAVAEESAEGAGDADTPAHDPETGEILEDA